MGWGFYVAYDLYIIANEDLLVRRTWCLSMVAVLSLPLFGGGMGGGGLFVCLFPGEVEWYAVSILGGGVCMGVLFFRFGGNSDDANDHGIGFWVSCSVERDSRGGFGPESRTTAATYRPYSHSKAFPAPTHTRRVKIGGGGGGGG